MPIDFIEESAPSTIDFVPEETTKSPGYLGPEWPAQEGEAIASDPERERKREELANQMRLARAERGLSDVIESFLGGAARAVEPLTPAGLMNQPTRIAGAIAGKTIPDIYQAGQPLLNVPQPTGTGFLAGLGQLGAQTLSGLTTPEMIVTAPAFPVSGVARALTAGQMAATLPESIARGGEVLRSPEATVAEKVVAAGQPLITAAMVKALTKAERILPQAAEAVRETKGTEYATEERNVPSDIREQRAGDDALRALPSPSSSGSLPTTTAIPQTETPSPAPQFSRLLLSNNPTVRVADPSVLVAINDPKILDTVVRDLPVEVMDMLATKQVSSEMLRNNPAMFEDALAINSDPKIASGVFGALKTAVTGLRAKLLNAFTTGRDIELSATLKASDLASGEIVRFLAPDGKGTVDISGMPEFSTASARAKLRSLGFTGTGKKLTITEFAPLADWHTKIVSKAKAEASGISVGKQELTELTPEQKLAQQRALDEALGQEPTPLPKGTPTEPSAAEPSQLTPAKQGISEPTTAQQITQAPFLDIPPEKWTPEYWKRIGDEGRRTVRSNLQGALQKLGSKTKITERSSPQAVFNAIAEVNKARTEPTLPLGPGAKTVGEPPYAAAQQLTDQLRATPPTGTKDAYTIRQKLADTWAQGKTIFERALGASRATAETLKDTARGVRAITDLDRRVGELDWLLQKSAGQSRNLSKAIIAQQKSKTTREAIALWIDAGGDVQVLKDTLANLPASTRPNIRRALETAVNLPLEARQFAQQIEQFYGIRLNDAREAEIFEKSLDDYFTHIWQKESNMPDKLRQAYSTGRVNDYFQFARQRKLPMFLDGILQGKTPELDPAKVLPYYNYALDRSIASRQFVKELSEVNAPDGRPAVLPTGTARRLEPNEEGAKGGIFINPKGKGEMGKDYHVIDHPAMRKWKWLGADEQGNPVMYRSDLAANPLVHERLARMLDQRLATPSKVGKALLRASTEVKGFKLGLLSAFHQVHVGSHALFHWTSPFKTGEIDWESPAVRYAVEKGHLKLAGDASQIAQFSEGLLSPGLVHKVPIVGPWSKAYSEWLFTDYIPRLKLKTFENALPRNLAWFAKDIAAGKITKEQVAARVGDAVNNAYGELNHWFLGKYGRSPQFQRILRGIFLAPDFGEARLRFVEKAFTKYGWEERMAFATMFLTLYGGARVANWLSHGDPETDLKNAFRVKVKIPGKDQMEWVSMRSVVGDLAHALTGFGQFMYVRLNPLYSRTISDILFQRDVYGRKLSFGDIAFKRPAQQLVPINFTGLTRKDQSLWESAVTSAGLQVQHDVPAMDIGKLKRKWLLSNPDPKLRSMGEKNEASLFPPSDYSPLRRALASGDLKQAGAEYDTLLTEKKKKHSDIVDALSWYTGGKEINGVYHERKIKPIGGQIGVDAEKMFLASLTPAERRLYAQALEERKRIYAKFLELMKSR